MHFRRRPRRGPWVLAFLALLSLLLLGAKSYLEWRATTISGTVSDELSGEPIPGATVGWRERQATTTEKGEFLLTGVDKTLTDVLVQVSAEEYQTQAFSSQREELRAQLRQDVLYGRVSGPAGEPVPRARVIAGAASTETDDQGEFRLKGAPRDPTLRVTAPGYRVASLQPEPGQRVQVRLEPWVARGLYMGFGLLSLPGSGERMLQQVAGAGLNTVIIDIKSDRGLVQEPLATPLSRELGASVAQPEEIVGLVQRFQARGVYTIARLVVFKDTPLATARPNLALRSNGALYRDCEGQSWVDPFQRETWSYNLDLAENATRLGFQEVQFDYIRFPSDCVVGRLEYAQEPTPEAQRAAIEGFLSEAARRLKPLGVLLSADVFGLTAVEEDIGVGQTIEGIAQHVDYVSPMVYPSTWRVGSFGSDYPPAEPHRIVHLSVRRAVERLKASPARVRPWLQAFDDYQRRGLRYGPQEVEAQIQAAQDAGALGWMLWDPFGNYSQLPGLR